MQDIEPRPLQCRIVIAVETVETDDMAAFGQQPARNVEADKARRTGDQYCLIRHHILKSDGSPAPSRPGLFSHCAQGVAIPDCTAIARSALKPYQGEFGARRRVLR